MDVCCFIERKTETRTIRWMCVVSLKERRSSSEVRRCVGVEAIGDVTRRRRLRWQGHAERKDDADYMTGCTTLMVKGKAPVDRLRKICQNT